MGMDVDKHVDDNLINELSQYFPAGTSQQEILELYNNPELFEQYINELKLHYADMEQSYSVYEECALPVFTQMWDQVWQLLLFCLLLRLLSMMKVPRSILNIISTVMGCLSLWKFYHQSMIYCVIPTILLLSFIQIRQTASGLFLSLVVTLYLLACEFVLLEPVEWNKVKGSVMITCMKIISIAFDMENGILENLTPLDFYGYVFNPASIIFGPFITFKDYEQLFFRHSLNLYWVFHCMKTLLLCAVCLLWSSCGTSNYLPKLSTYIPQLEGNVWWDAYKDAQSFRFSHYFVSYFSESTCLIMGVGTIVESTVMKTETENSISKNREKQEKNKKEKKNNRKHKDEDTSQSSTSSLPSENTVIWSRPVANLSPVEAPRSLVDVVTNWNLPMHYWLKQYVFKSTRKFGVFAAILFTYLGSSILHGLNFQLSAVLLSIGIFAYIESVFRNSLARIFNACIDGRRCKQDCSHAYKQWNFWVICVNLMFSLIAVWNLAYLGCLFDNSGEEEKGYSMAHALKKWNNYSYFNHVMMLVVFVIQKLISGGRIF